MEVEKAPSSEFRVLACFLCNGLHSVYWSFDVAVRQKEVQCRRALPPLLLIWFMCILVQLDIKQCVATIKWICALLNVSSDWFTSSICITCWPAPILQLPDVSNHQFERGSGFQAQSVKSIFTLFLACFQRKRPNLRYYSSIIPPDL